MRLCSNCQAQIKDGDRFCEVCGKEQDIAVLDTSEIMPLLCAECGAEYKKGALFCTNCGSSIAGSSISTEKELTKDSKDELKTELDEENEFINDRRCPYCNGLISKKTNECILCHKIVPPIKSTLTGPASLTDIPNNTDTYEEEMVCDFTTSSIVENNKCFSLSSEFISEYNRKIYHDESNLIGNELEFMQRVQFKIEENHVPAVIKRGTVAWEDGSNGKRESCYYVDIHPSNTLSNPFTSLIRFKEVGKFWFVEKAQYITPPPKFAYPGKKERVSFKSTTVFLALFLIFLFLFFRFSGKNAEFLAFSVFATIGFLIATIICLKRNLDSRRNNQYIDNKWSEIFDCWDQWEKIQLNCVYQERTGGELSRRFEAVYACIDQVCSEVFTTNPLTEKSDESQIGEIEKIISEKKKKLNGGW